MNYLSYTTGDLQQRGGLHTAKEISSQPGLWKKTYLRVVEEKKRISDFLGGIWNHDCPNIIFTGAGTSAFIGEALEGAYQKELGANCRAIATTDILTHPENYLTKSKPTLLISFARSGDSPESVATVEIAREHCDTLYELTITCNKDGHLARKTDNKNSLVFLLPEETNDRSLAMTSSFSSMLLAGLLILNIDRLEQMEPVVDRISKMGQHILNEYLPELKKIAEIDFERVVFLGSGPLFGTAHESHLKVQELSNGKVIGKFDSFLGFRHGPKAVVNSSTLIVYLLSNNSFVKPYELDLMQNVVETGDGEKSLAIGNYIENGEIDFDFSIRFPGGTDDIPEDFLSVFYVMPAQIIGFYKSLNLGLSPDSPSENGSISRVVQGVKIYHTMKSDLI